MLDITSFNKALKSVWIKKYLDKSNKGKWKLFMDAEVEPLGGPTVLDNLNLVDTKRATKKFNPLPQPQAKINTKNRHFVFMTPLSRRNENYKVCGKVSQ